MTRKQTSVVRRDGHSTSGISTRRRHIRLFLIPFLVIVGPALHADEGMWLFDNPPAQLLKDKYNFTIPPGWLDHLRKASVRFDDGGSGSFVSANGLVITNHHVGTDCIQKLGTREHDYIKTGFYARTQAEEAPCPDLELNVLMSMEDVTARVNGAIPRTADSAASEKARRAIVNTIEKESLDKTGFRSDVVTLYNGGAYQLYRYKKYTDVRLVFAPEKDAAFFGGDADNFEYPRYDLDICFFRVYENGKPAQVSDYLKWNRRGAADSDLIFVSGNPGSTSRLDTVAHLEFLRDRSNPWALQRLQRREVLLRVYSERSRENLRRAQDELFSIENSRKAYTGMQAGLQNPALLSQKRAEERRLRDAVNRDPKLRASYGGAWDDVAASLHILDGVYEDLSLFEAGSAFRGSLFPIARTLVRLAEETQKPNEARLREYSEAGLESLKQELFSDAPIYDDLEIVQLADSLSFLADTKGMRNELVQKILAGKSPQARAEELVRNTRLKDVAERKRLAEGGLRAIEASRDPMILLARLIDPEARRLHTIFANQIEEPQRQAYAKIAQARLAINKTAAYPDATFTLRLAFGLIKGYQENGEPIQPMTLISGAFAHAADHDNREPFHLPESWTSRQAELSPSVPLNFVSTADIVGGNSGSPVVNRAGEFVGIIFDGNIQSLGLDYAYTDQQARAIAVHSAGISEMLAKIYRTDRLLAELGLTQTK